MGRVEGGLLWFGSGGAGAGVVLGLKGERKDIAPYSGDCEGGEGEG